MTKPLLKWVGGKRSFVPMLADGIRSYLEKSKGTYIEPFIGGGAMAFALGLPKMSLSDKNGWLMEFYAVVRDNPEGLSAALRGLTLSPGIHKEAYLEVRETEFDDPITQAAKLLYLNKLCFNGLFRVNKSGQFNVPYGDAREKLSVEELCKSGLSTIFPNKERIAGASETLKDAYLSAGDFEGVIGHADDGDFLYIDPPYDETYGNYTPGGFTSTDQHRLAVALYKADKRGAKIVLHNSNTKKIHYFYHEWLDIFPVEERRAINVDVQNRSGAKCLVATNLPDCLNWGPT